MAMGTLVGFEPVRVATTADTVVKVASGGNYVCARLVAGSSAAATLHLYNGLTTAEATRVATLYAPADGIDEIGIPMRCPNGVTVSLSTATSAQAFIYTR